MRKALQAEQGKADMERKVSACHDLIFGEYILRKKSAFVLCDCDDVGVVSMWHKNVFVVPLFFFSHSQLSPFATVHSKGHSMKLLLITAVALHEIKLSTAVLTNIYWSIR